MDYTNKQTEEILNWLKENLSEERYFHTLGTAECAKELAQNYNLDKEKAYTAGLLHDCAKCFTTEKLLEIIKGNLDVEESEMLNYKTLHAPVSAYIAEKEFGVCDDEILSAIRWHTLGKTDMSLFEKIIFLADKIEPNTRDKEHIENIREILKEENGLNKALLKLYKETIKSLVKRDLKICLTTIEIYNKLQDITS
ncbi:MAG: bis(5'-nucleosyl)-tetraphosphatase (symmetrical) YqeK [Candidatus Gastranaerophilaceae bacterium]